MRDLLRSVALAILLASVVMLSARAQISGGILSSDPLRDSLIEVVPTGLISGELGEKDYRVVWRDQPLQGVSVELVPGSLEWSRVSETLLIPRVRIRLKSDVVRSVLVRAGGIQTLVTMARDGESGAVLVPLLGNEDVTLTASGQIFSFRLEFTPQDGRSRTFMDHSCSPFGVTAEIPRSEKPFWIWIGCRSVHNQSRERRRQLVDLHLVGETGGSAFEMNGTRVESLAPGIAVIRTNSVTRTHQLRSERGEIVLKQKASPDVPYGFLGVGLGPYRYDFRSPETTVQSQSVPLATVYGSYVLTDTTRLTAFNGTVIHRHFVTDSGIYFNSESFRALDRRISFQFMLGMNAMGIRTREGAKFRLGAPQGFEATWRDFFRKNYALNGGAFVYPKLNDTAYYNLWIRYGSRGYFVEANYLNIQNKIAGTPFTTKAVGLSFGMPVRRFFD